MKYRREIDGLRALAVLPVILFHAGMHAFSGGYVGVDVFFVISGYLITTIIISEHEAGTFTIAKFYERRARRILPALFLVMLTSMPFAWYWMTPDELKDLSQSFVAVSVFSSNILFWLESGYFEAAVDLKPFLHTWSLAVEEQYYVLFPLFVLTAWRFGKHGIFVLLTVIGLASLAIAQWGASNAPTANFYLLPSRLWELVLGCLTAIYLLRPGSSRSCISMTARQLFAVGGLLLILIAVFLMDEETPFPSVYALIPTIGTTLIILYGTEDTLIGQFLGNRVLVGVGLISYSAYLWHQPLFAFARLRNVVEPKPTLMVALGGIAVVLAFLTWKYVEMPFRDKSKISRRSIFQLAAALSVLISGVGIAGHLDDGFETRTTADGATFVDSNIYYRLRGNFGLSETCVHSFTLSEECRTDNSPEILLWGDSFAMHLMEGLLASNPDARVIQMTKNVCGPLIGISPTSKAYPEHWAETCIGFNNSVRDWVEENSTVRYAILGTSFDQYLTDDARLVVHQDVVPATPDLVFDYLMATLDFLSARGIRPVVFAPPPSNGHDLGGCLTKIALFGGKPRKCSFNMDAYRNHQRNIIELLRRIEQSYPVVWLNTAICSHGICNPAIDGHYIIKDKGHLSYEGSAYVGKKLDFYGLVTADGNARDGTSRSATRSRDMQELPVGQLSEP